MLTITHPPPPTSSSSSISTSVAYCKPNLLPCRIKYNGPVSASSRYWRVEKANDRRKENSKFEIMMAHFRGRRLRGRNIELPKGYKGMVLKSTGNTVLRKPWDSNKKDNGIKEQDREGNTSLANDIEEDEDEDALSESEVPQTMRVLQKVASFKDMTVWGHDIVPEEEEVYIRGINEWIGLAGSMHGFDDSGEPETPKVTVNENMK